MKKEIMELINSEEGTLKVNKFCMLRRWTKTALNEDVDKLEAIFSITHYSSHVVEIQSREWKSIVDEVALAQAKAFADSADELNKQLINGYIG